jgi:hypothetical protein
VRFFMKKMLIAAIAALGIISTTVFAADALNGAAGKKLMASKEARMFPTDVVVVNRSDNMIQIQNSGYAYNVASGDFKRFTSNNVGRVPLVIFNLYDNGTLMNGNVCNRAIVIVKGSYSYLKADIDGSQCVVK